MYILVYQDKINFRPFCEIAEDKKEISDLIQACIEEEMADIEDIKVYKVTKEFNVELQLVEKEG